MEWTDRSEIRLAEEESGLRMGETHRRAERHSSETDLEQKEGEGEQQQWE